MFSSASGLDAQTHQPTNMASALPAGNRHGSHDGQPRSSLAQKYRVNDAKHANAVPRLSKMIGTSIRGRDERCDRANPVQFTHSLSRHAPAGSPPRIRSAADVADRFLHFASARV